MKNSIEKDKNLLIPQNKFDLDTCKKIQKISDEDFIAVAEELLTWLKDANWPVFPEIIKIFIKRQDIAIEYISKIFITNDAIWQYWILTKLYPYLSGKNKNSMQKELTICLKNLLRKNIPDEDEIEVIKILNEILKN